ncbi:folate family ECF transporter S component [Aminicella lysinilytica]|uniref:folate family ECF transporter S component n=1 Tax=Aminicella lysinilytica TaxID=433323 RepID=UPI0026ED7BF8|nr:folate family ECF transporter S component [Aminicella lysinilytica]
MSKNNKTVTLVTLAFMIALEIILTRFLSVDVAGVARIGFGFIPVAMVAIMYGPWFAGGAYALGDILGMLIFPKGAYFPGFTLTACLTGIIFGLILYKKEITWKRSLLAAVIVVVTMNLFLDTYWLHILMGQGFLAMLPLRVVKCCFEIPVQAILIPLVWNKVFKRIPMARNAAAGNAKVA